MTELRSPYSTDPFATPDADELEDADGEDGALAGLAAPPSCSCSARTCGRPPAP